MSELLSANNKADSTATKRSISKNGFLLGLSVGVVCASAGLIYQQKQLELSLQQTNVQTNQLEQTLHYIEKEYVDQIDGERLRQAAIRGVMQELDNHSSYLDNTAYQELVSDTDGSYTGIGIEIETINKRVFIISPIDGSPAAQVGLRAGDEILKVDGKDIHELDYQELLGLARGKAGTNISLTLRRSNNPVSLRDNSDSEIAEDAEILEVNLLRAIIPLHSVKSAHLANGIAYLRLSHFTEKSGTDLIRAIENWKAKTQTPAGVILDLRNNPGGLVSTAVEVADLFLDNGLIVSAEGRTKEANFRHLAKPGDIIDQLPLVVLINHATASSAEIVAAALKEKSRATIVGYPSFGKGSVQSIIPMPHGDALKLTTSHYYTPTGLSLHGRGVNPHIKIDETALVVAVEELHALNKQLPLRSDEKSLYKLLTTLAIKDPALLRAWQHLDDQNKNYSQVAMDQKSRLNDK